MGIPLFYLGWAYAFWSPLFGSGESVWSFPNVILPDMRVPGMDRENMAGNYPAIDCGGFYVILAHLRNDSIRVAQGDRVQTG